MQNHLHITPNTRVSASNKAKLLVLYHMFQKYVIVRNVLHIGNLTEVSRRPVIPKAACAISGYVETPGMLSMHLFSKYPVQHDVILSASNITIAIHPPSLIVYGIERSPTPHKTLIPDIQNYESLIEMENLHF